MAFSYSPPVDAGLNTPRTPNYQYTTPPPAPPTSTISPSVGVNPNPAMSSPYQPYQPQSFFPQPVGNVYQLNSTAEIGNIPVGANLSVGLCLNENILYIKAFQNNETVLVGYRLVPLDGTQQSQPTQPSQVTQVTQAAPQVDTSNEFKQINDLLKSNNERIDRIEKTLNDLKTNGGKKLEWQI